MNLFYKYIKLLFFIFLFNSCRTSSLILQDQIEPKVRITLVDHRIQFVIPPTWNTYFSSKRYFHFIAISSDSIYGPRIEYRGLNNTSKTKQERDLYSLGWYQASEINFPKWKYIEKSYEEIPYKNYIIYSYKFIGEFYDGNIKIKKLGFLRFLDKRIHTIYYTDKESDFDANLPLFLKIDQNIEYEVLIDRY